MQLYLFGAIDAQGYQGRCAARGQIWLRKAQAELYKPGADMFPGDEDNGENGAWYCLSSLGLYSLSPGDLEYVFGSPRFSRVVINLDDVEKGRKLVIKADNNSPQNAVVQRVYWNNELIPAGANGISYDLLMGGGTLLFVMGPTRTGNVV